MSSSNSRGRGRGMNTPAWMSSDRSSSGGPPPPHSRDRYHRGGGGNDRRGPPPPHYHHRRRPRGPPPSSRHPRPNPNNRDTILFHSYEEEREFVHTRRRARLARTSKFDVPPTAEQIAMDELQKATLASTGPNPNVFLKPPPAGRVPPSPAVAGTMGEQVLLSPQQTRHARRLYIGNLPPELSETQVHEFFSESLKKALVDPPNEDPIVSVYIHEERRFAFVEFTSVEICTACLLLDGINVCNAGPVKVKRPNDYNPALAPTPTVNTNTLLDLSTLGIISPTVVDSPQKIFIGGLPYHLTDAQVMELLGAFGKLKAFHLVKSDASATNSKGYCFVEYLDPDVRDVAIAGLQGMELGNGKVLSARIASAQDNAEKDPTSAAAKLASVASTVGMVPVIGHSTAPGIMRIVDGIDVEALVDVAMGLAPLSAAAGGVGNGGSAAGAAAGGGVLEVANAALEAVKGINGGSNGANKTRVLVLLNMVTEEDFASDEDYNGLLEEVREECEKFGSLKSMKIPRPQDGTAPSAVKKIFLEYASVNDALNAEKELAGRKFGPSVVQVTFFNEDDYRNGALS